MKANGLAAFQQAVGGIFVTRIDHGQSRWARLSRVILFLNTSDNGCRPLQTRCPSLQSTLDNLAMGDLGTHAQDSSDAASLDQSASLSEA